MEQHPIPQNISSYQFRLVGDMTLKQFFEVGAGALISIILYSLPIHPIIKWPFIIFFSLFGVALAFLPFQERPLEQWIVAFFRSIYSPTVFRWKNDVKEDYFLKQTQQPNPLPKPIEKPATTQANIPFVNTLEETEGRFLSKLAGIFNSSQVPQPAVANPAPQTVSVPAPMANNTQGTVPSMSTSPQPNMFAGAVVPSPQEETSMQGYVPRPQVAIPQMGNVSVPKMVVEEAAPQAAPSGPLTTIPVSQTITPQGLVASKEAQFSSEAAAPSTPTIPNTVSGQVMDPEGKIIEGAILEIRDSEGRPVRALRSNKVGHFLTVTPLLNGKYELITEKEGYIFEALSINTTGQIIPPIAVRAKSRNVVSEVVN